MAEAPNISNLIAHSADYVGSRQECGWCNGEIASSQVGVEYRQHLICGRATTGNQKLPCDVDLSIQEDKIQSIACRDIKIRDITAGDRGVGARPRFKVRRNLIETCPIQQQAVIS